MRPEELAQLITEASASSEGEVVTRALSRDITLPHSAGTAVLITLDNGRGLTRPNTLGARGLGELNRALDTALARDDVAAIAKAAASSVSVTRRSPMNSPVLRMSQKSCSTVTGLGSSSGLTRQRVVARYHSTMSTIRNVA